MERSVESQRETREFELQRSVGRLEGKVAGLEARLHETRNCLDTLLLALATAARGPGSPPPPHPSHPLPSHPQPCEPLPAVIPQPDSGP